MLSGRGVVYNQDRAYVVRDMGGTLTIDLPVSGMIPNGTTLPSRILVFSAKWLAIAPCA